MLGKKAGKKRNIGSPWIRTKEEVKKIVVVSTMKRSDHRGLRKRRKTSAPNGAQREMSGGRDPGKDKTLGVPMRERHKVERKTTGSGYRVG